MELHRRTGESWAAWIGGMAVGALAMYVFDPQRGRRRRALARDKAIHAAHVAGDRFGATSRDLRNRAQGLVAETRSSLRHASPTGPATTDDGSTAPPRGNA